MATKSTLGRAFTVAAKDGIEPTTVATVPTANQSERSFMGRIYYVHRGDVKRA